MTTRTRRPAASTIPITPVTDCTCPGGTPTTVGHWAAETLIRVERRHRWSCGLPSTWLTPADWLDGTR